MDKDRQRQVGQIAAGMSEWRRLIVENEQLHIDVRNLRAALGIEWVHHESIYELNTDYVDRQGYLDKWWFFIEGDEKRVILLNEIDLLMHRHSIPRRWVEETREYVITGQIPVRYSTSDNLFTIRFVDDNGEKLQEPRIILHHLDALNGVALHVLKNVLSRRDQPLPKPQPIKGNTRKKDWRPVWEWHRRHPEVSVNEIARRLNLKREYVYRKLTEVEDEFGETK